MECTPKCRLTKHADLVLSAITKEDAASIRAILPRICSNFARVSDQFGRNALHLAASCGKGDILEWLVKDQALDVGSKDLESGWTALHRSLFYGYLDSAVKLIQLGSDLGWYDREGLTPYDLIRLDAPFQIAKGVQAQAVSPYETSLEDELQLQVGNIIKDIHMNDGSYWTGYLKGRRGHFPKDHVELLSEAYQLELFTWGSNTNFTLGHRDESTRHTPELVENVQGETKISFREVVMCKFHSVFLSMDGRVFTCGHGRGGRLGHGNEETHLVVKEVKALQGINCVSIAAGQDHTVVVTDDGSVYTFGLNDSHQLGHGQSPLPKQCLLPKMVHLKVWRGKDVVGAAAGRYHSVFFTRHEVYSCGLNAGQLGHQKGEKYQTLPRQVSGLADKGVTINKVTCSDGATVCATDKGDIFLLNQYMCRKIISRFTDLVHISVIGGELDMISPQEVSKKFADELAVTLLNSRGRVFQWKPKFAGSCLRECSWHHNRQITVRDFAIGKQLFIVSDDGEAFICQPSGAKPIPSKTNTHKMCWSPPNSFEGKAGSMLAQSPPLSSPITNMILKEKDEALSQSFPSTTPLSCLAKEKAKKDTFVEYNLERIPLIHRGQQIFTDSKSRGCAVLQVSSREGLQKLPEVSPERISEQMIQLLEEATCEDDIHDVEFMVKEQRIPAHGFVLASQSLKCHQLLCENKEDHSQVSNKRTQSIPLHESVTHGEVVSWLKRLYGGFDIGDEEIFPLDVSVTKGKNGFSGISKTMLREKVSGKMTKKEAKGKRSEVEKDGGKSLIDNNLLSDLTFLSTRDLDDFSAPTVDLDDMLFNSGELLEGSVQDSDAGGETQGKTFQPQKSITTRKGIKGDLSRSCNRLLMFSRLNCPELYDVTLLSEEGTELRCHKCILVARLEYFRSMLTSSWRESSGQSRTLRMPFPALILEIVLDFLYSGQARRLTEIIDLELLGNILIVADQLLIWRLREMCEVVIANLVTLRNVSEVLEFSILYNANQLRDVCSEYICNNLGSLMESRALDCLSDEALVEITKTYRSMVPRMAWRMITPLDLHCSILLDTGSEPTCSPGKRRRSSGRKKSSKSESEQDAVVNSETAQEGSEAENVYRVNVQELEEVFEHQNGGECKTDTEGKIGEGDACLKQPKTDEEETSLKGEQVDVGMWYRKLSPDATKTPKKKCRDRRKPGGKSVEDSGGKLASQKEDATTQKAPSPEKPAWSNQSTSSPPATSLKDIMEQEQNKESPDIRTTSEVLISPSKGKSPQSPSIRWSSAGRQSQKQRKRSKSNSMDDHNDVNSKKEEKELERPPAWGGVIKDSSPIQSLRDLIQEEEKKRNIPDQTPSPKMSIISGKSGSTKKKLNWRRQPGLYTNGSEPNGEAPVDLASGRDSSVPLSPPKSAWQSVPIACSPPSSSIAFSTILECEEKENTTLNRFSEKPFHLTQLEERAMEELLQYYGGKDNACEFVTVERIPSTAAKPVWRKERPPSVASN